MKPIHALLALLASLCLCGPSAAEPVPGDAASVTIGALPIALPVLPGYAPPSATPQLLVDVTSRALPPTNRLLAVMLPTDFLDKVQGGDIKAPLSRYLAVQTFPAYEDSGMTPALFAQVKTVLRAQSAQLFEKAQGEIAASTDRLSSEVGKITGDSSTSIRTSDNSSLGIFDEQPDSISMAALQTVSASSQKGSTQIRQAMALAAMRVHGKVLMASVYSNYESQADIDWVEAQMRAWVKRLNELNP